MSAAPDSASFADDFGAGILAAAFAARPIYRLKRMPFLSTEDTLLGDPQFGFPCPWITSHPFAGYHSSADTPDLIDPVGLSFSAMAMACYLYCLADLETAEALEIAQWQSARVHEALEKDSRTERARRTQLRSQFEQTIDRLGRFVPEREREKFRSAIPNIAVRAISTSDSRATPSNIDPRGGSDSNSASRPGSHAGECLAACPETARQFISEMDA